MNSTQWRRVAAIFEAALERPAEDRATYLAAACEGDESLRIEVERLLASYEQAGDFLEQAPPFSSAFESNETPDREDLPLGATVSRYQITAKLGCGGMGVVYRAMDMKLRRPVALKVSRCRSPRATAAERRFLREARAASALNHPNICHIYEIGEAQGLRFIAMEFVEGRTLEAVIADGPLELSEISRLGAQLADALTEAHAHGIIHRDIKPANLMIGPRGDLKVLDFGLAKASAGAEGALRDTDDSGLTRSGMVLGTVQYMSPEQLMAQDLDHRTDIFSFGLVLYEMAAARPAFDGATGAEVSANILYKNAETIERWPALDRLVSQCLRKDRESRYQSAGEIARDLRNLGPPPSRTRPRRFRARPFVPIVAVPLILLVLFGTARLVHFHAALKTTPASPSALAALQWDRVRFEKIASLGDPAPGGGSFMKYLIPESLNNRGDLTFDAELGPGRGDVLLLSRSEARSSPFPLARAGAPAPGGGVFDMGVYGPASLNDAGDVAFPFGLKSPNNAQLSGFELAGLFRYGHDRGGVDAVVIPGQTASPVSGVFQSVGDHPVINNSGIIVFSGMIKTKAGLSSTPGLGQGIFTVDVSRRMAKVAAPGDIAPGGRAFDWTANPWINDRGDVAFGGHVAGEECISLLPVGCGESIYLAIAPEARMESVAHQGEAAPRAGSYVIAWGPVLNDQGAILFLGELTKPGYRAARAIFLHSRHSSVAIAAPGDTMPDGRKIVNPVPAWLTANYSLNRAGDVCFNASLENGESAFYILSGGKLYLLAGTGTAIPGAGTISSVINEVASGGILNDNGEVLFSATLTDGKGVLLLAHARGATQPRAER
jgi:serine/threonine protein kinase